MNIGDGMLRQTVFGTVMHEKCIGLCKEYLYATKDNEKKYGRYASHSFPKKGSSYIMKKQSVLSSIIQNDNTFYYYKYRFFIDCSSPFKELKQFVFP